MVDFNGFDKGVIGRKLPSDTTLNNMRKADLIELLHLAESNHRVLAETYKIAIDTSKCNHCPLSIDTRRAEQISADAIDEITKVLCDELDKGYIFMNKHQIIHFAKQLKEQKHIDK